MLPFLPFLPQVWLEFVKQFYARQNHQYGILLVALNILHLHKHMSILHKSDWMQEEFEEKPMAVYRRDRNLADTLLHGKLKRDMPRPRQACKTDCKTCSTRTGTTSTCTERDVIYGLTCTERYKVVYVVETRKQLKERIKEHFRQT